MATFRVARASVYLAITGWGIDDVKLAKKAWAWVGQRYRRYSVAPVSYEMEVDAMSSEKLPFVLGAAFTVGPRIDGGDGDKRDDDALLRYAKLLAPRRSSERESSHVRELVKGVIEGQTRVLAAGMTMEQTIHQGNKGFRKEVFDHVQLYLDKFGLYIYAASFKKAKVDMVVGDKEREGMKLQKAAEVDAQTKVISARQEAVAMKEQAKAQAEVKVVENERGALVVAAMGKLATKKAGWDQKTGLAEVEAAMAVAIREAELQMELERRKTKCLTEKLRDEQLSKATVAYDTQVLESNGAWYSRQKMAEAALFEQAKSAEAWLFGEVKAAEARKAQADARFLELKLAEDAKLYASQKQAPRPRDGGEASAMQQACKVLSAAQEQAGTVPPAWMGGLATNGDAKGSDGRRRVPI
ncbi:Flotillin-like protein 2 [Dichanthelium oligosanthes]|uniref:Flotillin-like n=1 Tax=Dichanthelium oligosanthes TaxID=888268 RepID=A0A1E5UKT1_9POAL|nr:Flotillin-like protein 2 [Dichanthelium oligosanthes]